MEKVDFKKLNSANIAADNSVDSAKMYDITANININGDRVNNIESGVVMKGDIQVASFSKWGENQMNINFMNVDAMEMCTIITEINAFCQAVNEKVIAEPIEL